MNKRALKSQPSNDSEGSKGTDSGARAKKVVKRRKRRFGPMAKMLLIRLARYLMQVRWILSTKVVMGAYEALFSDLSIPSIDFNRLKARTLTEGFTFLSTSLPLLEKSLLAGLEDGFFRCPTNFRRRGALPVFLGSLFNRVFDLRGSLRTDADAKAVASLRQILSYAYKAEMPRDPKKDAEVLRKFVETETDLKEFVVPDDALIAICRKLTAGLFADFDYSQLIPKHGPGVTSNVPIIEKYDHKLQAGLPVYSLFGTTFFFNEEDAMSRLDRYPTWNNHTLFQGNSAKAKVILVNKDSRGPRLISCEPCEHQYAQQAIMRYMVRKLESSSLTAGHVNFTDNTANRRIAEESSKDGFYATLDLKDASDRNTLSLFKRLFGESTLGHYILACRTHQTELPDGTNLLLSKFAPMGSALCFPVMAYSLYILIYVALIGIGVDHKDALAHTFVYGDDIIVPSQHSAFIQKILERYGFKVNTQKSYSNGKFRESCGADFFDGYDVTPVRLRKIWPKTIDKQSLLKQAALYAKHAQSLGTKGLGRTAEYYYSLAERYLGPLPYGSENSPYICRVVPSQVVVAYQKAANELNCRTKSSFVGWKVLPLERSTETTGWGHLMRVIGQLGRGEPVSKFGIFSLPREWDLVPRRYRLNELWRWI